MASTIKGFIAFLVITSAFLVVNLPIMGSTNAESIANPAIPQFTVNYHKASYTSTDPYTGVPQQIDNSTIVIIVQNQHFIAVYDSTNNVTTSLYYNAQVKGHYSGKWADAFSSINYSSPTGGNIYTWYNYPIQSNTDTTIITLPANYTEGSQVDVRLQAVIANQTSIIIPNFIPNPIRGGEYTQENVMFVVETSDWSPIQTIAVTDNSATPTATSNESDLSQSPAASSPQPNVGSSGLFGLDLVSITVIALLCVIVVLLVFVVVFLRRRSRVPV